MITGSINIHICRCMDLHPVTKAQCILQDGHSVIHEGWLYDSLQRWSLTERRGTKCSATLDLPQIGSEVETVICVLESPHSACDHESWTLSGTNVTWTEKPKRL